MGDQEREWIRACALRVDKVNPQTLNRCPILRKGIDEFFLLPPIEVLQPILLDRLEISQVDAVLPIGVRDLIGPARVREAGREIVQYTLIKGNLVGEEFPSPPPNLSTLSP